MARTALVSVRHSFTTRPSFTITSGTVDFVLGGRKFAFRMKPSFPKTLSREFLLVDLVNNLDQLAESKEEVLTRVRESVASYDAVRRPRLRRAALEYGNVRTKKFFSEALNADMAPHVR